MRLPAATQIEALHAELIARWGGETGFYDETRGAGALESALYAAAMAVSVEAPTPYEAAALLGAYLLTGHPFLDGNKRTATATILVTLDLNGIRMRVSDRDLFRKIVGVQAATERSWTERARALAPREVVADLAPWLARRATRGHARRR